MDFETAMWRIRVGAITEFVRATIAADMNISETFALLDPNNDDVVDASELSFFRDLLLSPMQIDMLFRDIAQSDEQLDAQAVDAKFYEQNLWLITKLKISQNVSK